jgi:hypothetical protein
MQKNTKIGIGCLIAPPIAFVLILGLWAVISMVASSLIQSDQSVTGFNYLNIGLGLSGIICLLALPIGIIVGMIFLLRKNKEPEKTNNNVS